MAKLIMTLLVRDEGDIIRDNIEFHLKHGVDYIIATDNASVDNSREILAEYQAMGKLHLIDEPGRDKSQAAWNNRMTRIAMEKYDADLVFHCDADEFWYPAIGDLKTEIMNTSHDVMLVNLVNVILENHNGKESLINNKSYAVVKPLQASFDYEYEEKTKYSNLYLYRYPLKVFFRTSKGILEVDQGNHNIVNSNDTISQGISKNIFIFHFPVRGRERFRRKVIETGKAVEKNPILSKSQSFHIRRWFDAYKSGTLDREYEKLTLNEQVAAELKEDGILSDFDFSSFTRHKRNDDVMYQIQKNLIDIDLMNHKQIVSDLCNQAIATRDNQITALTTEVEKLTTELEKLTVEMDTIKSSLSWRVTKPLRYVNTLLHGDWTAIIKYLSKGRSNG